MNTSILYPIHEQVSACTNIEAAKELILNQLAAAPVQDKHIKQMHMQVKYQIHSLDKLVKWLYNNLLAKEGLQVI